MQPVYRIELVAYRESWLLRALQKREPKRALGSLKSSLNVCSGLVSFCSGHQGCTVSWPTLTENTKISLKVNNFNIILNLKILIII
jgi:hypothetical protein